MKKRMDALCAVLLALLFLSACNKHNPYEPFKNLADYAALVDVPGGTYLQSDGVYSFVHTVSSFKMGKYEVTWDIWEPVKKWGDANGYSFAMGTGSTGMPVTNVRWRDVMVWCNAYSVKSGLTPCYTFGGAAIKDANNAAASDNAVCVWSNNGFRLPTEGEWQYAASYINGTNWTPFNYASGANAYYGNTTENNRVSWTSANSGLVKHTAGTREANYLGIFDMTGNVWELCWDFYGAYPGTSTDYRGPSSGTQRVTKGGSYIRSVYYYGEVGSRASEYSYIAGEDIGFRIARSF